MEHRIVTRPIQFGGFDYEDETGLAERIELSLIQMLPDSPPVPHHAHVPVGDDGTALWNFEDPTSHISIVTYTVLGPGGTTIDTSPSFASFPGSGGYITAAEGLTTITLGGNVVNTLKCVTVEPIAVREFSSPGIRTGIQFGGFDYEDETGGAIERVTVVATTKPPDADDATEQDPKTLRVKRNKARWAPSSLYHVIKLTFTTELVGGGEAGGEAEHTVPEGMYIDTAQGHTTDIVLKNEFTGWTVERR